MLDSMTQIIVIGHGGYAEGVRTNLEMVIGVPENMHFLNFSLGMERGELEAALNVLAESLAGEELLFCVDLPGATPFQLAAILTAQAPERCCTAVGLNSMAYMEMAMDPAGSPRELAERAIQTTKDSLILFPE